MKRILKVLLPALFLLTILCSCMTFGPAFTKVENIPEGMGIIYVYRLANFVGSAVSYDVMLNGEYIGTLRNGGYFYTIVEPGEYKVSAKTEIESIAFVKVENGGESYIRGGITMGMFIGRPELMSVSTLQGETDIVRCNLIK